MKVIGRTGSASYDSYLVEMTVGEMRLITGTQHPERVGVGTTIDVDKVWKSVRDILTAESSLLTYGKTLHALGDMCGDVAKRIGASITVPDEKVDAQL